jgi:hypothetical protein
MHELESEWIDGDTGQTRRVSSVALASGRVGEVQLRARAGYEWTPDSHLEALSATASWPLGPNTTATLLAIHSGAEPSDTSVGGSLTWTHPRFALGIDFRHGTERGSMLGVSLSTSFAREPGSRKWIQRGRKLAASASAVARVFLDHNANDVFDAGDEPIPGARFLGAQNSTQMVTNSSGRLFLSELPAERLHQVRLDASSLVDPFWVPTVEGYSMVGHPGGEVELDFPVRVSSEIEGTIYIDRGAGPQEARNVEVELVDSQDQVVQTTRSEFDGYFLFQRVPPGRYRVRLAAHSARALRLALPPEVQIGLPKQGGVVAGVDLILRPARPQGPAAP